MEKLHRDILKWVIIGLVGFVGLVLIFGAGMLVGGMKARFSYSWAENYHKNFGGPRGGFLNDWQNFPKGDFLEGHGVFGEIIELNPSAGSPTSSEQAGTSSEQASFVIKGQDNVEKIIVIAKGTIVNKGRETIKDGLKVGDFVVIIGSPNEKGQIEAKLIRIMPKPPIGIRFEDQPKKRLW